MELTSPAPGKVLVTSSTVSKNPKNICSGPSGPCDHHRLEPPALERPRSQNLWKWRGRMLERFAGWLHDILKTRLPHQFGWEFLQFVNAKRVADQAKTSSGKRKLKEPDPATAPAHAIALAKTAEVDSKTATRVPEETLKTKPAAAINCLLIWCLGKPVGHSWPATATQTARKQQRSQHLKFKARARSTAKETKDALEQRYMQGRGMQKQSNRNHMIPVNNQVKLAWTKLGPLTHQL